MLAVDPYIYAGQESKMLKRLQWYAYLGSKCIGATDNAVVAEDLRQHSVKFQVNRLRSFAVLVITLEPGYSTFDASIC